MIVGGASADSGRVGNGGNVVLCGSGSGRGKAIQLLDYYEAEIRGIQIDLGAPELSVEEKVALALSRLAKVSPRRARLYQAWADSFYTEARFMPNISLRDTDDSLNIILPNGCEIKQLVVQRLPKVPEDRLYTISEDLWKLMDNDEKAGVILHEVIYREAIYSFKHTDSFHSRYLNSYISSHRVDNYTPRTFLEFLKNLEFYTGEIQGVEFYIGGTLPEFYDNGVLKSGRPARGSKIWIFGLSAELNEGASLVFYGELSFYPNGVVESGRLARGLRQTYKTDWIEAFFDTDGVRVEFSPNGFFRDALRGVVSKRMRFGTGHDSDPSRQGFAPCSKT